MSLIILLIVVLIIAGLLWFAVDQVPQIAPFAGLLKALIAVLAVAYIATQAGLL